MNTQMNDPETILDELKEALRDGTITKEEARSLLATIDSALETDAEDGALDKVIKGRVLTVRATLAKIL